MVERGGELTIGVLGPFELTMDGRPVALTSGRLRTLLAVLALAGGQPVSVDRLAIAVWGDSLPGNARRVVQTYLTRLRSAIGTERITTGPTGYRLHIDPDQVDALRFVRLLDHAVAPDQLTGALRLWRGTPFDGVRSDWLERTEAPRLTERYLAAVERRVDLDLAAGHHHRLVAQLQELTAEHPLRESLWVRLLLVLERSGRQAEALDSYETIRVRLAEALGTDPGPELRQIHADLLAGRPAGPTPPARSVIPRQLPADIDGFTGREAALKALDGLISEGDGRRSTPVVISAIAGTAGVGKTALAVRWAHRIADRFPDGQLYVNLRGFHTSGQAMDPAEAMHGLLEALDVPPTRVPSSLEAQAGLFRSLLAGRRMLILLDNARDAAQVRPLLPGSPGCLVIVTSRNRLTGLVATEAARPVMLDPLTRDEARALLARRFGADRVAAEPAATDEIITRCAGLPLALVIAAARAATRPGFPLAALAAELRDAGNGGLAALTTGDPSTDVRAVFAWSYRTLSPDAARLFRLLGLHPGPDVSGPAAASLAGMTVPDAGRLLAELTHAHLLAEPAPGRYACHDLLRGFASELTEAHDPEPARRAARHRMLDHYLHTAHAASMLLYPQREPILASAGAPDAAAPEDLADHQDALAWFGREHRVLLAAVELAAGTGCDVHAWRLAWSLVEYLDRQARLQELLAVLHTGLAAARRVGERAGQARAHRDLARVLTRLARYDDAYQQLAHALDRYRELDDRVGQAHVHLNLGFVFERDCRRTAALASNQRALEIYQEAGDRVGEARALNGIGWCHSQLGDHRQALAHCERAVDLHRQTGNRYGEAATWDSLGYAHHHLGNHPAALACYRRALALNQEIGDLGLAAEIHRHLGDALLAAGDPDAARDSFRRALAILDQLDHPDAGQLRARLGPLVRDHQ